VGIHESYSYYVMSSVYKRTRIPKGQTKMDYSEKLAPLGTQDTEWRQTKQKHTTKLKETQITQLRHGSSYKQLEVNNIDKTWVLLQNNWR
jgi:hypothetical protein